MVSDGSISTIFSSNYKPFGALYGSTGSETFTYTGKPFDLTTGLYYFGARFYLPTIQRFISEDSLAGTAIDPQSLNRYVYARNNPLTITDSTGHAGNPMGKGTTAQRNTTPIIGAISSAVSTR
jgi:RHS repeat-associated protein